MWITFLSFEDLTHYPQHPLLTLAEDDIKNESFIHFGKLLSFPGSLPRIHDIETKQDPEGLSLVQKLLQSPASCL